MSISNEDYIPKKYITLDDVLGHLGFNQSQIAVMASTDRERYLIWQKEANSRVETDLYPYSDDIPLDVSSMQLTYARSAALNWIMYKKRDKEGSKNAINSKNDYDRDIKAIRLMLARTPSQKQYPVNAQVNNSLADYLYPYSQTQGFPPNLLY